MNSEGSSSRKKQIREERAMAASKYKPKRVRLLLVAEAPPGADDRYFYFEDVREQDSLFREVTKAIVGETPTRHNKPEFLSRLMRKGVFLVDLKLDPVDGTELESYVPDLITRCRELKPDKIILIKVTVFDAAYAPLRDAGLPVIDKRLPFPGSGRQKEFRDGMLGIMGTVSLD